MAISRFLLSRLAFLTMIAFANVPAVLTAQTPDNLPTARAFVRSLSNDPAKDQTLFRDLGEERAAALLMQVFHQGMSAKASLDDWADQHKALSGLIEFYDGRTDPTDIYRASMFAGLQDFAYRDHEGDYVRALEAAQQSLELVQRSGLVQIIYTNWASVGRDFLSLGRIDDAVSALRKSRDLIQSSEMYSRNASHVWRNIVTAELARHNLSGAAEEVDRFLQVATSAPPYFRAESQLAVADLKVAEGRYGDVPAIVTGALQSILDPAERTTFGYEAGLELMECVLASISQLSYPEALALATKMDTEIEGLPFPVSGFAQRAIRTRRRLAGDLAGTLREDSMLVDQARASGQVHSEIEALRLLASDFAAANSISNQIATLDQAVTAERSLLPRNGIPLGYPDTYSFARTLTDLSNAYTRVKPFGPTERMKAEGLLAEASKAIDDQPAAADRERLASLRGEVQLERADILALGNQRETAREVLAGALDNSGRARYDKSDIYLRLARLDSEDAPDAAAANYDFAVAELGSSRQSLREVAAHIEAARALALKDRLELAQKHLKTAIAGMERAEFADADWKVAYISGILWQMNAQPDEAVVAYFASIEKLESLRSGVGEDQRQAFTDSDWMSDLYARLVATLSDLGRDQEAWQYSERAKARIFVESLQGRQFKEAIPPKSQVGLAVLEKQMIDLRLKLAPENDLALRSSGSSAMALKSQLSDLEARFTLARERAGLSRSRASQAVARKPLGLLDLQAKLKQLDKTGMIIEYAILPDGLTAFLIGSRSFEQVSWKVNIQTLAEEVRQLRGLLADRSSGEELGPIAARVAQSVWFPLAAKLPTEARHLMIAPAAFLNYLPFQMLPLSGGEQLIDRFTISYLPSASTLGLLGKAEPLGRDLFLGALGSVAVEGWPPLSGTLAEVKGIANIYSGATVVKEYALTHDAVLQALRDHEIVHLATHGIYDSHAPLFSALLTSPATNQPARVSLYELTDIQLKAKLVVLSACDSGTGKLFQGDEIAGLTRTILSAGAKTVVSSLWTVDDESTALLMQAFYKELGRGRSPSTALRSAALAVRKKYPHPMFWAPFVVTGSP